MAPIGYEVLPCMEGPPALPSLPDIPDLPEIPDLPQIPAEWLDALLAASSVLQDLIAMLKAQGMAATDALAEARAMLEAGIGMIEKEVLAAGDKLYQLVPMAIEALGPYWMKAQELEKLAKMSPEEIAEQLGLPPDPVGYALKEIKALKDTDIYKNQVAPLVDQARELADRAKQAAADAKKEAEKAIADAKQAAKDAIERVKAAADDFTPPSVPSMPSV